MGNHYKISVMETYDAWYANNIPKIRNGEWNLVDQEILQNPENDRLRGLNIIAYVPEIINQAINSKIIASLGAVIGDVRWIIPEQGRHFTILDIIPHNSGISFKEQKEQLPNYLNVIKNAVDDFSGKVQITLEGVFASPDGVTIQGYPSNDGLHNLRQLLRNNLNSARLTNLEHKKYVIETAHVALVKFIQPADGEKLLATVDKLRHIDIGIFEVNEIVLNFSPRYDKHETIEVVERFAVKQYSPL